MAAEKRLCEKYYLELSAPTEEDNKSDLTRILEALREKGVNCTGMPLHLLRKLYPMFREADGRVTVTVAYPGDEPVIAGIEPGDTSSAWYGLAVDYGSSTVIMQLIRMRDGHVLAEASEVNGQTEFGSDILTRITYALESQEHKDDLQRVTAETFNKLFDILKEKTGIDVRRCGSIVISGNTTMIHFLLGLDAWSVFAAPYAPITTDPGWYYASELGLSMDGIAYIIPAASNYIGGDIVSGLLTLDFYEHDEISMFFDIGTNGELVLGNREWLIAGAGAAGPALEGYISKFGIRACPGAIEAVKIENGQLSFRTIEGEKPVGICGSGIIDLVAQMRLAGWINIAGDLNQNASGRIREIEEGELAVVYADESESADGQPLYFSQTDIKQYLNTKAAAHTMIDCILDIGGFDENDIGKFYLSGAFGNHTDLESAITVGIFPDLPRDKFVGLRNSSLDGARTMLLDMNKRKDIDRLLQDIYCVQFASVPDFAVRMRAAKFIPHTDIEKYPSVKAKL